MTKYNIGRGSILQAIRDLSHYDSDSYFTHEIILRQVIQAERVQLLLHSPSRTELLQNLESLSEEGELEKAIIMGGFPKRTGVSNFRPNMRVGYRLPKSKLPSNP